MCASACMPMKTANSKAAVQKAAKAHRWGAHDEGADGVSSYADVLVRP